jgi:copper chaperone
MTSVEQEPSMLIFQVQDMTCGHCVKAITTALRGVDPDATLHFDLAAHQVRIEPVTAGAEALRAAVVSAGYTAELSTSAPITKVGSCATTTRQCCCG